MNHDSRSPGKDERGAALIFAIVFLVVVSGVGASMVSLLASSQYDRNTFDLARDREYAADAAVEADIAVVRTNLASGASPCPSPAFSLSTPAYLQGGVSSPVSITVAVACQYFETQTLSGRVQRNATFSATCSSGPPVCPRTNSGKSPIVVEAQVDYQSMSPLSANKIIFSPPGPNTFVQSWTVDP